MKHRILFSLMPFSLCAYLLLTSCKRNELCYETGVPIQVIINWDLTNLTTNQLPENMHLLFFPAGGGNLILDYVESTGGMIRLQEGDYAVLTFNDNTEHIYFRGKQSYTTIEAYVKQITPKRFTTPRAGEVIIDQPDSLYVAATDNFNVHPSPHILVLEKAPISYVRQIPFTFRSVRGMQYLSGIEITVDNLAQSIILYSGEPSQQTGTVLPRYSISGDKITGYFTTFGHYYSPQIKHTFTITFLYDGKPIVKQYDVTHMMDTYDRIDITDNITFDPIDNPGGFNPGVNDWEHEDVELD